jgi:hypothetical protein
MPVLLQSEWEITLKLIFRPTTFYKQRRWSGSESEGHAFVGDMQVGHALVRVDRKVGVIIVIGPIKCRLKERAGNWVGGYTSGDDGKWDKLSKFSSRK